MAFTFSRSFDSEAERVTKYVHARLIKAGVPANDVLGEELEESPRFDILDQVRRGLEVAYATGGEHWEAMFLGSMEILIHRVLENTHSYSSYEMLVRPPPQGVSAGKRYTPLTELSFDVCPLWPFC